jgi:hypothetical protein
MAGRPTFGTQLRGGITGIAAALLLTLNVPARAQNPTVLAPVPPPAPAPTFDVAQPATEPVFLQPTFPGTANGANPAATRTEMGLFDTITESLFGDVYAEGQWRPLSLSTLFSEGWLEPWAAAPAGRDGLTPRHGWLGSFDGVFYRLWFATFGYSHDLKTPFGGNWYTGDYSIFLPFSRRFEVFLDVPFVVANGTKNPARGYTSQFGDLNIVPRILLSETAATTQVFALSIRTPTGTTGTGNGVMALTPRYEFWTNPGGPWVVRAASSSR